VELVFNRKCLIDLIAASNSFVTQLRPLQIRSRNKIKWKSFWNREKGNKKVIETYFVCVFSVEEFKTFLNCQHSSKSIRTKPQLSLGLLKISLPNLKREINSWLNLRCCRTPSCKRIDRISRTDLLCPNIYFGCYLEGSPLQGLKLWGPGTFYVPPGGMPAGPVPHPGQPTAVAQNGTVYYHHTPVRAVSNCQMLFIFWQPFYKTSFLTCFQTLVRITQSDSDA
jgi:hypothetical protein